MKNIICLFLLMLAQAVSADEIQAVNITDINSSSTREVRKNSAEQYLSVGVITLQSEIFCSMMVVRHGLLITAKHCFQHKGLSPENVDLSTFSTVYTKDGTIGIRGGVGTVLASPNLLTIQPTKLLFDSGDNDIAYLFYDAKETEGKIQLEDFEIATANDRPQGRNLKLVGFPAPREFPFEELMNRVVSIDCKETDKVGKIPPMEKEKGFDGLLIETTCAAWSGNSGGPVFALPVNKKDPKKLIGVLTHTFYLKENGELDSNHLKSDSIGYYMDGNYSPLSSSRDLSRLLKK
jgi:V8-like Glu-specific endopeptidase